MNVISSCLSAFCGASGARVNIDKTRMLVSSNVNKNRARELSSISGFCLTSDFGKYMGVPIIHGHKKNSLYEFIVEKVRKRLSSWKAKSLTFA
ncbi:putative ribonuclease H protein, partial [Trifolium medium]|nr:putative ribonuclease H protein [Trifolium medium]